MLGQLHSSQSALAGLLFLLNDPLDTGLPATNTCQRRTVREAQKHCATPYECCCLHRHGGKGKQAGKSPRKPESAGAFKGPNVHAHSQEPEFDKVL